MANKSPWRKKIRWIDPRKEVATIHQHDDMAYTMYGYMLAKRLIDNLDCKLSDLKMKKVLDYGCGTGIVTRFLSPIFHAAFGYDPSIECINSAISEHNRVKDIVKPVHYTTNIAAVLSNKFDAIICSNVFIHLTEREEKEALKNMVSCLSDKGMLLLWFRPDKNKYTAKLCNVDEKISHMVVQQIKNDILRNKEVSNG